MNTDTRKSKANNYKYMRFQILITHMKENNCGKCNGKENSRKSNAKKLCT